MKKSLAALYLLEKSGIPVLLRISGFTEHTAKKTIGTCFGIISIITITLAVSVAVAIAITITITITLAVGCLVNVHVIGKDTDIGYFAFFDIDCNCPEYFLIREVLPNHKNSGVSMFHQQESIRTHKHARPLHNQSYTNPLQSDR